MQKHVLMLGGDEPYMIDSKRIAIVSRLQLPELNFISSDSFDEAVVSHLVTLPVVDDHRVAFVKVDDLKKLDTSLFHEYVKEPSGILIVQFREWDERTSFFKNMQKAGVVNICTKKDTAKSLRPFIQKMAAKMCAVFSDNALDVFLDRVCYVDNEGVNLYTLLGYLRSLSAISKTITPAVVCDIVPEFLNEDRYRIIRMILDGDVKSLKIQAELLKKEAIGILSLLLREYRIAYKAFYYPLKDIGCNFSVLSKEPKERITEGIEILTAAIESIKKGNAVTDTVLQEVFLRLVKKEG